MLVCSAVGKKSNNPVYNVLIYTNLLFYYSASAIFLPDFVTFLLSVLETFKEVSDNVDISSQ